LGKLREGLEGLALLTLGRWEEDGVRRGREIELRALTMAAGARELETSRESGRGRRVR